MGYIGDIFGAYMVSLSLSLYIYIYTYICDGGINPLNRGYNQQHR
jgi:hypothetical protein